MSKQPAGTVTFLSADLDPDAAGEPSAAREWLGPVSQQIGAHAGHALEAGPGVRGAFASALAAVNAALAARAALPADSPVRMAVHTGPVNLRGGRYTGAPVERLRHLLAASHGGQTVVSSVCRELVRDEVAPGVDLTDLGTSHLRDLLRPIRVFQLSAPGEPREFPPLDTLEAYTHNLPIQSTSFLGREGELEQGRRLLAGARIVTLTGLQGTGKSRLALQLAADRVHAFPDGAWRVDLGSLTDTRRIAAHVVAALQIREQPGTPVEDTVVSYLRPCRLLLVLDNCERLGAPVADLVSAIASACPNVAVLVTSDAPLGVAGEAVLPVPPLGIPIIPVPTSGTPLAVLTQYEAVQLFLERAGTVLPGFEPTNDNLPGIAEICHRVEGIPLAIELTAAHVADVPVDDIAFSLAGRLDDIAGGAPLPLPRHEVLGEVVGWALDRLGPRERLLLDRLAVFAGRFSLDGVLAVCAGDGLEAADIAGLLWGLVRFGLARSRPEAGATEFQLLEPIRACALERLAAAGEEPRTRARLLQWAVQWSRATEEVLAGPEPQPSLARMERQHDNFRAALEWGLAERRQGWEGVELAAHLGLFWYQHGHFREGRDWLERALAKCGDEAPRGLRAWVSYYLAALIHPSGEQARAGLLLEEALALFRDLGDMRGVGWALNDLGLIALNNGDAAAADHLLGRALEVKRAVGNELDIGVTVSNLGEVARLRGDMARARDCYEESLEHLRHVSRPDRTPRAVYPLANLGYAALHERQPLSAAAHFRAALELERDVGDPRSVAMVLAGLACVAAQRGQLERSAMLFGVVDGLLATQNVVLDRTDRSDALWHAELVRSQMPSDAYDAAFAAGRGLSLADAVEFGLEAAGADG